MESLWPTARNKQAHAVALEINAPIYDYFAMDFLRSVLNYYLNYFMNYTRIEAGRPDGSSGYSRMLLFHCVDFVS